MWPKRKILVVVPPGEEEKQGFFALLEALQIERIIREAAPAEASLDLTGLAIPGVGGTNGEDLGHGPTELIYWPEIGETDGYRQWAQSQGLMQQQVQDFLHTLWEEEIIFPVSLVTQVGGFPVLWRLLAEAGYEPSLIWPESGEKWKARIGRGIHWVVPEDWFKAFFPEEFQLNARGREPFNGLPEAGWIIRDEWVDFYGDKLSFRYLGTVQRYPEPQVEKIIYDSVLQALQLGVTWRDVKKNLRWNTDAIQWDRGADRTECFVEDPQHLENRWVS